MCICICMCRTTGGCSFPRGELGAGGMAWGKEAEALLQLLGRRPCLGGSSGAWWAIQASGLLACSIWDVLCTWLPDQQACWRGVEWKALGIQIKMIFFSCTSRLELCVIQYCFLITFNLFLPFYFYFHVPILGSYSTYFYCHNCFKSPLTSIKSICNARSMPYFPKKFRYQAIILNIKHEGWSNFC